MEVNASGLKRFAMFSDVPEENLAKVVPLVVVRPFKAKEKIFDEGSDGDRIDLVSEGTVRISKFVEGVGEEALSLLQPGSYFGEMSIIDSRPRSATAIAHTDCEIWEIPRDGFIALLKEDRDIAYHVLWTFLTTMAQRLRDTNEKIKAFFAMTTGF